MEQSRIEEDHRNTDNHEIFYVREILNLISNTLLELPDKGAILALQLLKYVKDSLPQFGLGPHLELLVYQLKHSMKDDDVSVAGASAIGGSQFNFGTKPVEVQQTEPRFADVTQHQIES